MKQTSLYWALRLVPEILPELVVMPPAAAEMLCELGLLASGFWDATWLRGIHREVLRVVRTGRLPADEGPEGPNYPTAADDPDAISDQDIEKMRELLDGEAEPVPDWLHDPLRHPLPEWIRTTWQKTEGEPIVEGFLLCKRCNDRQRLARLGCIEGLLTDELRFGLAFAWLHRGCETTVVRLPNWTQHDDSNLRQRATERSDE